MVQQHDPSHNPTTARKTGSKNDNKLAMMSYFKRTPKARIPKKNVGYWKDIGTFDLKERKLADLVRSMRKNID